MEPDKRDGEEQVSHIDDKTDAIVHKAELAVHGVELSMMADPEIRAEMPGFFSRQCLRAISVCLAGYFSTMLYGYDGGMLYDFCF